ncbi:MAG: DUF4924 family protein [Bacteroidales bacterium]|nr:DUF4924 family protein [Bacteroidales bacterium]
MKVAQEKRKNNIAEYVLYMWQLEDLLRAFKFDIQALEKNVFGVFSTEETERKKFIEWYTNIIQMMEMENIKVKGHLQVTKNVMLDLNTLHVELLKTPAEEKYREYYYKAAPNFYEFQKKIPNEIHEVEMMFLGLYGLLLMRIQKKEISEETEVAMKTFSDLMALLSQKYHAREKKEKEEWL